MTTASPSDTPTTLLGLDRRSLLLALAVLGTLGGCASAPPRPPARLSEANQPASLESERPGDRLTLQLGQEVAFKAASLADRPYRWGGEVPEKGFDCSGLIQYCYQQAAGIKLPRTVAQMAQVGRPISVPEMRAGDIVLFNTTRAYSHAGIFIGERKFIHAPSTGGIVRLAKMDTPYWSKRLAGGRRV